MILLIDIGSGCGGGGAANLYGEMLSESVSHRLFESVAVRECCEI